MSVALRLAAAVLALGPGASGCARPVDAETQAAPDAAPAPGDERPDGPAATLSFAGVGPVTVRPLRIEGEKRVSCAVELTAPGSAAQRLVTIGEGGTEALGCTGIKAFGRVPAPVGTARIALLYDAFSPNAEVLAPVVVEAETRAAWRVNDELSQLLSETGRLDTIAAVRKSLASTGR